MPRISEFNGIVIYMYWRDNKKHRTPHFHAYYRNRMALFSIFLEGALSEILEEKRQI